MHYNFYLKHFLIRAIIKKIDSWSYSLKQPRHTQPWLNTTLTGNHSLTSFPTRTPAQLCTAFINFPPTKCILSICHIPCQSIVSYAFYRFLNAQNKYFPLDTLHPPFLAANTWSILPLPCLNPHCSYRIALSVPTLTLFISTTVEKTFSTTKIEPVASIFMSIFILWHSRNG